MYEETTRGIRVQVEPSFLEAQSEPEQGRFLWAYRVTIENRGAETVQLLSRHWRITDARGQTREVVGPGVIGEQPTLAPGERFQYTSGAPLETSSGFMTGTYQMRSNAGDKFDISIPMFALESPYAARQMH
jgi:ApaG protein